MTVFEHVVLPARNKVTWVDATSGNDGAGSSTIARELTLNLDPVGVADANPRPTDVAVRNGASGFAFWHDSTGDVQPGPDRPDEAVFSHPAYPAIDFNGEVSDPVRQFLPRRFALTAAAVPANGPVPPAERLQVDLFRRPEATLFGKGGGLYGQVAWNINQPAAWARLQLSVAGEVPWIYNAQANELGEFRISTFRLAPQVDLLGLPAATLRIFARNNADPDDPIIAENQPQADVAIPLSVSYPGVNNHPAPVPNVGQALTFQLIPGRVGRLQSANQSHIAIAPP